jgi:hypothetical protein
MRVDKDVAGAVSGERAGVDEVREAVALAVREPSIHNTQPWRWEFGPDGVDLYADRRRQLAAIDPDGRGLLGPPRFFRTVDLWLVHAAWLVFQ